MKRLIVMLTALLTVASIGGVVNNKIDVKAETTTATTGSATSESTAKIVCVSDISAVGDLTSIAKDKFSNVATSEKAGSLKYQFTADEPCIIQIPCVAKINGSDYSTSETIKYSVSCDNCGTSIVGEKSAFNGVSTTLTVPLEAGTYYFNVSWTESSYHYSDSCLASDNYISFGVGSYAVNRYGSKDGTSTDNCALVKSSKACTQFFSSSVKTQYLKFIVPDSSSITAACTITNETDLTTSSTSKITISILDSDKQTIATTYSYYGYNSSLNATVKRGTYYLAVTCDADVFGIGATNVKSTAGFSTKTKSTEGKVKLNWSKVSKATSYRIYQYSNITKKYCLTGVTKNLNYTVKKLTVGVKYKFFVTAIKNNKTIKLVKYTRRAK